MTSTVHISTLKYVLVSGLILQTIGQCLFNFNDTFNLTEPIDIIHWLLLIGASLIIPTLPYFSNKFFSKIGIPLAYIGLIAQIGMCAIDFVFWSFGDNSDGRNTLIDQLINEPSIWPPFISLGPALTFFGFAFISYDSFKSNFIGFLIVNLAVIIIGIQAYILPDILTLRCIGYIMFCIGLISIFYKQHKTK